MNPKRMLIIGGSGGIGRATAQLCRARGFMVISTYLRERPNDASIDWRALDVRNPAMMSDVVGAIQREGPIDVIVYAPTSPISYTPLPQAEWHEFADHLDVQVRGFYHLLAALRSDMFGRHPMHIIVLLTEACFGKPPSRLAPYIAAKSALFGLAKASAVELARYGTRVNMVSPGMTHTPLIARMPPKLLELEAEQNPLGRIAEPEDVAQVIAFLASDGASYLNGENVFVNGGAVMV